MTLSVLSSTYSATTTTSTASSSSLDLTTDEFLQLMIEQLQNQDPTSPTDTSEYLGQLMDLSSYEAEIATADKLDSIVTSLDTMLSTNGLGYLGQTVSADGDTTSLQDGEASWSYNLAEDAQNVTISIYDKDGDLVYSQEGETGQGSHDFTWDGVTSAGEQLADGSYYTMSVAATGSEGAAITTSTSIYGTVSGIDSSTDITYLMIGEVGLAMDSITSIVAS